MCSIYGSIFVWGKPWKNNIPLSQTSNSISDCYVSVHRDVQQHLGFVLILQNVKKFKFNFLLYPNKKTKKVEEYWNHLFLIKYITKIKLQNFCKKTDERRIFMQFNISKCKYLKTFYRSNFFSCYFHLHTIKTL